MFLGPLLTKQQDIGQHIGAEQGAESFPEDDSRCKDTDDNKQHDEINDCHQYRTEQKTDANKQRIFEHSANRIVKTGEKRENIHQDDGVGGCRDKENCHTECPEYIFKPYMVQYITVNAKDDPQRQKDQPDLRPLLQIVFKRVEK